MGVFLHICMCTTRMQYPPRLEEVEDPLELELLQLCSTKRALGTQPERSAKQHVLLSTEPSLQSQRTLIFPNFLLICENVCEFFNLSVPRFFYLESCRKVLQNGF